ELGREGEGAGGGLPLRGRLEQARRAVAHLARDRDPPEEVASGRLVLVEGVERLEGALRGDRRPPRGGGHEEREGRGAVRPSGCGQSLHGPGGGLEGHRQLTKENARGSSGAMIP